MAITTQDRSELVNELLERIAQTVGENAKASTIFGDPVERAGVTVVPVAKARFGFGGGGGSGTRATTAPSSSGSPRPEICWRSLRPARLP